MWINTSIGLRFIPVKQTEQGLWYPKANDKIDHFLDFGKMVKDQKEIIDENYWGLIWQKQK